MSPLNSELASAYSAPLGIGTAVSTPLTMPLTEEASLSTQSSPSNIAFVDADLDSVDTLIAGLENTQVILLDTGKNGINQITSTLAQYQDLDAIHIISHAADGLLQLGNILLSNDNIDAHGQQLEQWAQALSTEADLMIYGCNLAAGSDGLSLLSQLGKLTGADVAASDDLTGAAGDWTLEVATGKIESEIALSANAQDLYDGELALQQKGDYEQELSGWRALRGSESITTDAVSGSAALEIAGTSRGIRQTVSAVGGETYTLTGSGKTSSDGNTSIGMTFYDASGNRLAGKAQKVRASSWDDFSIERIAPDGTHSIRVWAYKANDSGSFFLDNLALNSGSSEPPIPPTDGSELLANAGFEAGLSQWKKYTGSESTTSTGVFEGTKALQLTAAGSGARQILDAVAGETYQISGYGKKSSDGYVGFGITFYDANNQKINGSGAGRSVNSADWRLYESEAVAPDNARFVRFWVYKANGNGQGFLDQLSLTTEGATPPPPPVDTTAPSASFTDAYITASGATSYEFEIEFEDDTAVDVSTLTNNDISVVGPNGFSQLAQFVSVNNNTNGPSRTATYRITPPGGSWDSSDNGIYTVELRANQVGDTSGNLANAVTLGNIDVTIAGRIDLGNLNAGIAARDGATGTGYLMYSEELLPVRFLDNPPYSSTTYGDNANNLIAVVSQNGQWFYDDNFNLRAFTPRSTDLLLAELDFSADTATVLQGQNRLINGIRAGYESGDLTVTPNVWNGSSSGALRNGEFGVTGTYVTVSNDGIFEGQLSFASSMVEIEEDAGNLSVTVNRTDGSDGQVAVNYATSGVSATPGQDFTSTSGTLVFEEGQTSRTIQVPITNDTDSEEDETFFINLSDPTGGATLGTSGMAVTILNDDAPPTPGNPGDLLPDLLPIASTLTEALRMDTTTLSGRTILRLSTEVANTGAGPLEIWGGSASGDSQAVLQRIYNDTGGSRDVLAGEFVYHPAHGHIHFEGFATYSLRQVTAGNGVGSILASGGKTSFCLINIRQPFPELTNAAQVADGRGGDDCGQIQGIDVGYSDVYGANLPDQWIDVTNVSDGTYWLEAIADPDDNLLEQDETNNVARVQITLNNGQVFA